MHCLHYVAKLKIFSYFSTAFVRKRGKKKTGVAGFSFRLCGKK